MRSVSVEIHSITLLLILQAFLKQLGMDVVTTAGYPQDTESTKLQIAHQIKAGVAQMGCFVVRSRPVHWTSLVLDYKQSTWLTLTQQPYP